MTEIDISTMTEIDISTNESIPIDPQEHSPSWTIESENVEHETKYEQRMKTFKEILSNTLEKSSLLRTILYGFTGSLVTVTVAIISYALFPTRRNVFHCPSYWYEQPLIYGIASGPILAAFIMTNCSYWINVCYIMKIRNFVVLCIVQLMELAVLYTSGYMIWTHVLLYNYPIPHNWMVWNIILLSYYITLWFQFPPGWRKNDGFRKRLIAVFIAITYNQVIFTQYIAFATVLLTFDKKKQWILAICMPFIREMNIWIMKKLAYRATSGDSSGVSLTITFNINTMHSLFLSYILGSISTQVTSAIILSMDFMLNLYSSFRIVWLKKKRPEEKEKAIELLQELVIIEMVEFIVPLIYVLVFCCVYYGPNASLFGNIGNGYWQYVAVEDVVHTIKTVCIFFFVDLCSSIIISMVLWFSCHINLFRAYEALQKEFGFIFMLTLVCYLSLVSKPTSQSTGHKC